MIQQKKQLFGAVSSVDKRMLCENKEVIK